jgi:hypothetical protein
MQWLLELVVDKLQWGLELVCIVFVHMLGFFSVLENEYEYQNAHCRMHAYLLFLTHRS